MKAFMAMLITGVLMTGMSLVANSCEEKRAPVQTPTERPLQTGRQPAPHWTSR